MKLYPILAPLRKESKHLTERSGWLKTMFRSSRGHSADPWLVSTASIPASSKFQRLQCVKSHLREKTRQRLSFTFQSVHDLLLLLWIDGHGVATWPVLTALTTLTAVRIWYVFNANGAIILTKRCLWRKGIFSLHVHKYRSIWSIWILLASYRTRGDMVIAAFMWVTFPDTIFKTSYILWM